MSVVLSHSGCGTLFRELQEMYNSGKSEKRKAGVSPVGWGPPRGWVTGIKRRGGNPQQSDEQRAAEVCGHRFQPWFCCTYQPYDFGKVIQPV